MELEFDKYCVVDGSPTTVLPSPRHCPKLENRRSKRKQKCGNQKLCLNEDFTQNNFHHYRSVSCKDSLSRTSRSELRNEVLRRGSAYCSSKELRRFQKTDAGDERRKIEFSSGCITASSFGIVDALCSSDEDRSQVEESTSAVMLVNSGLSTGACKNLDAHSFKSPPIHLIPEKGGSPGNGENRYKGNNPRETDDHSSAVFPKSLSAKFRVPHSPARSESDCSRASSSKSRFTPMRKMFDPFRKSKSQRSPLSNKSIESGWGDLECKLASLNGNKGSRKPLPPKFSNTTTQQFDCGSLPSRKGSHNSLASTYLHGFLRLDRRHGVPFFEFSVNFPEDVFLAKTWKVGNNLNWVYTFYSVRNRRKSHGSGCGSNDGTKESSVLVGQMQVSSSYYLCSKVKNATGVSNNYSMVMEFVLYDTAKANPRKSVSFWESSSPSSDVPKRGSTENLLGGNNESKNGDTGTHPVCAAELHEQQLEIAAIVIQVPVVQKRESLEFKSDQSTLLGFPFFEGAHGNVNPSTSRVAAVIPSGNHSLPTTQSHGPSPLLDRWRSGGGCDCGGWDMACPLNVLYNLNIQSASDCPLIDNERPLQLFIQGKKDKKTPALSIRMMEGGQYGVDFHAQLSALQAFSISVAILHAMEAAASSCMEKEEEGRSQMQESAGGLLLVEDEVTSSTKTVRKEGNKKVQQPSFVLDPPFSPIARV